MTANSLKRLNKIVYVLTRRSPIKLKDLQAELYRLDVPISKSQIDKDLRRLKDDFDCPIKSTPVGVFINKEYNFIEALENLIM